MLTIRSMSVFTEKPTLFVVARRNDLLEKHGENLRIRDAETNEIRKRIPALGLRDIVIFGDITMQANIFSLAEKHSLPIHFLSTGGKFKATTLFDPPKNVFLRHRQFQLFEDKREKIQIAKTFVQAKVHNQNTFLQKIRAKGRITVSLDKVVDIDVLRGMEGSSAKKYFTIWKEENLLKNTGFIFPGRIKRPATDPVNALLSFCFSMIHSEIHTQLLIAGLDPFMGYLHDQTYGHPALASDFTEIFRGPIEHFVIKTLNRKEFLKEDFEEEEGGSVKLSREGFQKFFPKWSAFLRKDLMENDRNLTRVIERDIRKFVHYLMGDEPEFRPFIWKK